MSDMPPMDEGMDFEEMPEITDTSDSSLDSTQQEVDGMLDWEDTGQAGDSASLDSYGDSTDLEEASTEAFDTPPAGDASDWENPPAATDAATQDLADGSLEEPVSDAALDAQPAPEQVETSDMGQDEIQDASAAGDGIEPPAVDAEDAQAWADSSTANMEAADNAQDQVDAYAADASDQELPPDQQPSFNDVRYDDTGDDGDRYAPQDDRDVDFPGDDRAPEEETTAWQDAGTSVDSTMVESTSESARAQLQQYADGKTDTVPDTDEKNPTDTSDTDDATTFNHPKIENDINKETQPVHLPGGERKG